MIQRVDWDDLSNGIPVLYHGDFQPENIIVTDENKYMLHISDNNVKRFVPLFVRKKV